jgi:MFS family permease
MEEARGSSEPTIEKLSSSQDSDFDYSDSHENMDRRSSHHSAHAPKQHQDLELAKTKSIAETMSPVREILFVGLLCSAQFVTQAGLLGTLNILHIIGPDLGITDPGVLSWLIAGYSLTVGTFILLSGRCGDLFGYKNMLIVGYVWFAIWNLVAGCSIYVEGNGGQVLFIFSRVLGGIGPAILLPNALGLLGATYNEGKRKDMVFSLFGACAPGTYCLCDSLVCLLTFCRWCCSWRNIRWPLVALVVAMDLLDIWHCALLPCHPLDLHTSLCTSR